MLISIQIISEELSILDNHLDRISQTVKQKIYESILQALGEDQQEANAYLNLKTHVSAPFLKWDLIYRNLMSSFGSDNVEYSATKRGMWTVLLLYDPDSSLLISFMRDKRLEDIKHLKTTNQPQYVRALIALNEELQAPIKQQRLFEIDELCEKDESELMVVLNELCTGFNRNIDYENTHHVLVCFSEQNGNLISLNAYVLDQDLDIVSTQDWLHGVKPIMSNVIETVDTDNHRPTLSLKLKAKNRIREKELVSLRENDAESQAQ